MTDSRQQELFTSMFREIPELTSTIYVEPDLTPLSVIEVRADVNPLVYGVSSPTWVDLFA